MFIYIEGESLRLIGELLSSSVQATRWVWQVTCAALGTETNPTDVSENLSVRLLTGWIAFYQPSREMVKHKLLCRLGPSPATHWGLLLLSQDRAPVLCLRTPLLGSWGATDFLQLQLESEAHRRRSGISYLQVTTIILPYTSHITTKSSCFWSDHLQLSTKSLHNEAKHYHCYFIHQVYKNLYQVLLGSGQKS